MNGWEHTYLPTPRQIHLDKHCIHTEVHMNIYLLRGGLISPFPDQEGNKLHDV
jgi:hypothetical protein